MIHLRIHLHHQVPLLGHVFIPVLDLLFDPRAEGLAENRVCHVGNPLLRQLLDLALVRVILEGLVVLPDELVETFD